MIDILIGELSIFEFKCSGIDMKSRAWISLLSVLIRVRTGSFVLPRFIS